MQFVNPFYLLHGNKNYLVAYIRGNIIFFDFIIEYMCLV